MLFGPEIPTISGNKPKQLVIMLHGVGSNGDNLLDLADWLNVALPDGHFIAPNAPYPYDYPQDEAYQWFSLADRSADKMLAGSRKASSYLNQFIDEQLARFNLTEDNLVVLGFSQGTMMALHTCLRRPKPVALIVGFSGVLIAPELLETEMLSKPKTMLLYGVDDDRISPEHMRRSAAILDNLEVDVEEYCYHHLGHSIGQEGLMEVAKCLKSLFHK